MRGSVRLDRKTKNLTGRLKQGEIAVIDHPDLDETAAEALVRCRVKAVLNARPCLTGEYPAQGASKLLSESVPVLDSLGEAIFEGLAEGDEVEIDGEKVLKAGKVVAAGRLLTPDRVKVELEAARRNLKGKLEAFLDNTLEYAKREKDFFLLDKLRIPQVKTSIKSRPVLVVIRGQDYLRDLKAIKPYIDEVSPVLVGVDGGADALMEFGYRPDMIIGDMDSVSDEALRCGAELVVHAYPDGRAPGRERLDGLGLPSLVFPAPGTSEDIALLLAYEKGADLIVAVGTHSNIIDFLEKGRPGMASTFLVRMKVGSILVDARGVSRLYRSRPKPRQVAVLVISAVLPALILLLVASPGGGFLRLLWLRLRLLFGL